MKKMDLGRSILCREHACFEPNELTRKRHSRGYTAAGKRTLLEPIYEAARLRAYEAAHALPQGNRGNAYRFNVGGDRATHRRAIFDVYCKLLAPLVLIVIIYFALAIVASFFFQDRVRRYDPADEYEQYESARGPVD